MRKFKLLSLVLSVMMFFACISVVFVQADDPVETQPEVIVTDPVASEIVTDPPVPSGTGTDVTVPSGTGVTDSSGTGTTEATEPDFSRPTEYSEPSTYSDYVSPAPIYTPGEQNYDKQKWENLALDISGTNSKGPGSFEYIQNDHSKGDRINWVWKILWGLFGCLSIAAITFAILYRPQKSKKKPATSVAHRTSASVRSASGSQKKHRTPSPRYEKKYSDDYNDGF